MKLISVVKENRVSREKKITIVFSGIILSLLTIVYLNEKCSTKNFCLIQKQNNSSVIKKLDEINSEIKTLKDEPSIKKQHEIIFNKIENYLVSLKDELMKVAKVTGIEKISSQISSTKDEVNAKINDLQKTIANNGDNKDYLSDNNLPFHVIGIDVIAGQSYISVDYDHHILPLAIGDNLAGWHVNQANYDAQTAEFVNLKNQFIRINLKGLSGENNL